MILDVRVCVSLSGITSRTRQTHRTTEPWMWAAEAFLDGRRVGEVDDLVSRAEMSYPVAELRTVLTG
jgi:hypothetical protein